MDWFHSYYSQAESDLQSLLQIRYAVYTRNISFGNSLRWPIYIINSADEKKIISLPSPTDAAPKFLEKLIPFIIR